jgi:hypothetical protein
LDIAFNGMELQNRIPIRYSCRSEQINSSATSGLTRI